MGVEAPKIQIPEQLTPTSEEIASVFHEAQQALYGLTNEPAFHARCMGEGINPYDDVNTPRYWEQIARYAGERVDETRLQSGNTLQLSTLELVALTPDYLFKQTALNRKSHPNAEARRIAKHTVSYFNTAIRMFASEFPETRASVMNKALLSAANIALEDRDMRQGAAHEIAQTIRGAQHELAFWQILAHTGRNFSPASLEEDLRGIDYIVDGYGGKRLHVDVKASLSEVESRGASNKAYVRKPNGTIIMYSLTRDSELQDYFFTPDHVAAEKAPVLNQFLILAQKEAEAA